MIEDGVGVVGDLWWFLWHVGGGIGILPTCSNPSIFQSPISNRVWILWYVGGGIVILPTFSNLSISKVWILDFPFTKSPFQLPEIRPITNLLSIKSLRWKLENPKISKFTQKSPNFQSRRQSPISKVQKLSNLKGTVPDRPIITI